MRVFNTLCLDVTLDEWLAGVEDAGMPNAWADGGWAGMSPGELVCVCLLTSPFFLAQVISQSKLVF